MKRLAAGIVFATSIAVPAVAADMLVKAPVYQPPLPVFSWTGFYVGANAGYSWMQDPSVNSVGTPIFANPTPGAFPGPGLAAGVAGVTTPIGTSNTGGFIAGGQIGYNHQFNMVVAGIEADIQGLSGRGSGNTSNVLPYVGFPPDLVHTNLTASKSVDWLGTLRGQLGYTITPTLLIYGTGGLAYGGVKTENAIGQFITGAPACAGGLCVPYGSLASGDSTRVGWTAGAGTAWMLTGNWRAKLEYLYYDLGSVTYGAGLSNVVGAPGGAVPAGAVFYSLGQASSASFRGNIVRVGLNYKFN
jgi:outer membrane immunogenic protein